jgi:hypothetical protein
MTTSLSASGDFDDLFGFGSTPFAESRTTATKSETEGRAKHINATYRAQELFLRDDIYDHIDTESAFRIFSEEGFSIVGQVNAERGEDSVHVYWLWSEESILMRVEVLGGLLQSIYLFFNYEVKVPQTVLRHPISGNFHSASYYRGEYVFIGDVFLKDGLRHCLSVLRSEGSFRKGVWLGLSDNLSAALSPHRLLPSDSIFYRSEDSPEDEIHYLGVTTLRKIGAVS